MHVNSHSLSRVNSTCLLYIAWCGFRLSCYNTTRESRHHSTPAVVIALTDDFLRVFFVAARFTSTVTSFSSCLQACFWTWHPWGLSPVWLHVLRTCVCIAVFDLRAYDRQLKTKLHFRGRVNNNARALTIFLCRSMLNLQSNQLQQLPAGVFSSLTSLRSLTCVVVCIENVCEHVCVWLPSVWSSASNKITV